MFDTNWYRSVHHIDEKSQTSLSHYIDSKNDRLISPTPFFDSEFYLENYSDIAESDVNPFRHYMDWGHREGRDPSNQFKTSFYRSAYLSADPAINPLQHYLEYGKAAGLTPLPDDNVANVASEVRRNTAVSDFFEPIENYAAFRGRERAKVITFYLPQFHTFPENDEWWGKGFTEWTNIVRGNPRFVGHYQPRIPRDLGFYDLSQPGVLERQVEMAKQAGIYGFCFYFYWFNGKRLLERPLERLLASPDIQMPFCLMWANENWTRRWDGQEQEVLIRQDYAEKDDPALIETFLRHFSDPRYIRVEGRPLLFIYRAKVIPNLKSRLVNWRLMFQEKGEQPLILMAQTFNDDDPRPYGFDGAVEFPPHKVSGNAPTITNQLELLDPQFSGTVWKYDDVVDVSLKEDPAAFPLLKTVFPMWDNDARRQGRGGSIIHGSTVSAYEKWLNGAISYASQHPFHGEKIVFINAWNEWAEGAYLEPDVHHGAAYLNATARTIYGRPAVEQKKHLDRSKIILIGHDAHPFGAQLNLLGVARWLSTGFGVEVATILLDGGPLIEQYKLYGQAHLCQTPDQIQEICLSLSQQGFCNAVVNTVAAGRAVPILKELGYHITSLVHELPRVIRNYGLEARAHWIAAHSDVLVFASPFVRDPFLAMTRGTRATIMVRAQGLYTEPTFDPAPREIVRQTLGIADNTKLVVNIGYGDLRKGLDLFIETARLAQRNQLDLQFLWVGKIDPSLDLWLIGPDHEHLPSNVLLLGFKEEVSDYYSAADIFFLTSREDPFPTVVMEAIHAGLPVVAFSGGGGYGDLLEDERFGKLVPMGDINTALNVIDNLQTEGRTTRAVDWAAHCRRQFSHRDYAFDLLRMGQPSLKKVSVVIPSYNYESYMAERLDSVFAQNYPVYEVLVLDDASSDNSVTVAKATASAAGREITIVINDNNSGNVFAQWRKGADLSQGELLWIAEADDAAEPNFLTTLATRLDPQGGALAFCDSVAISPDGMEVMPSYIPYCEAEAPGRFSQDFTLDGWSFAKECLSVKNTILNVSGVIWSTATFRSVLAIVGPALTQFKVAGDWRLYAEAALLGQQISYVAAPLNRHRRHPQSVTQDTDKRKHLDEVISMQEFMHSRLRLDTAKQRTMYEYRKSLMKQLKVNE